MAWLVAVLLGILVIDSAMSAYKTSVEEYRGQTLFHMAIAVAALVAVGYVAKWWL